MKVWHLPFHDMFISFNQSIYPSTSSNKSKIEWKLFCSFMTKNKTKQNKAHGYQTKWLAFDALKSTRRQAARGSRTVGSRPSANI